MLAVMLEPNVGSCSASCGMRSRSPRPSNYSAGISSCDEGEQWQLAMSLLSEMWEAKLGLNANSFSAGVSACGKGQQWQMAMSLLSEIWEAKLGLNAISFSVGTSACGQGEQWQQALALPSEMLGVKLEPTIICYSTPISTCETNGAAFGTDALTCQQWIPHGFAPVSHNALINAC
ncbi:unnamed protein product [Prorocentrum cordatum]|uniref:Subtilisin n=1 Tax=Prorocentrum cordatum TaxID=2364126 RepID=A0ABN9SM84_9DINO|nr:unnamed protein product [Polarella glacialis]